jgi:hypothetical protein
MEEPGAAVVEVELVAVDLVTPPPPTPAKEKRLSVVLADKLYSASRSLRAFLRLTAAQQTALVFVGSLGYDAGSLACVQSRSLGAADSHVLLGPSFVPAGTSSTSCSLPPSSS